MFHCQDDVTSGLTEHKKCDSLSSVTNSDLFKKCYEKLYKNNHMKLSKSDKKAKQLMREIEHIEMGLIKKVDMNPSGCGSLDNLLVDNKYKEDLFRVLWNKQQPRGTKVIRGSRQTLS